MQGSDQELRINYDNESVSNTLHRPTVDIEDSSEKYRTAIGFSHNQKTGAGTKSKTKVMVRPSKAANSGNDTARNNMDSSEEKKNRKLLIQSLKNKSQ